MKKNVFLLLLLTIGLNVGIAKTGVAFIHGKTDGPRTESEAINYWTSDMISTTTKGYSVPHVVCHYDGSQFMWVAGNEVANQLYDFIVTNQIDDLVINTHSFGGVVTRWIFSNPDYNSKYQTIIDATRWVNTIAGPHKGSEAADLAGTLSGSWLTGWLVELVGSQNNSTKNCRTDWMDYYNENWLFGTEGRPALPKPFYAISGNGLWNDFCSEDVGLATLSGIAGMPGEDDGVVSEYSAEAVGTLWFRTEANHHHNRRNDYRSIGESLASDF